MSWWDFGIFAGQSSGLSGFYIVYTAIFHRRLHMHVERPEPYSPLTSTVHHLITLGPAHFPPFRLSYCRSLPLSLRELYS